MKKGFLFLFICIFHTAFSQDGDSLSLSEIVVTSKAPVTKDVIQKEFIKQNNLAADVPFLLNQTPSTVATSDAGNGIGYTGIRIRGTDASRILVSIDGVPINDSESQAVFWVNMPDVASSAQNIVVQRGVGSSSNGTSNFGGSIQINTDEFDKDFHAEWQSVGGSFGTYKNTLLLESGNWAKNKLNLRLRLSKLLSDGYIDRASSNLQALQFEAKYQWNQNANVKINYLSGKEKTYQAWYGVDQYTLQEDRRFNYAGAIYNDDYTEILGFYPNQIDHYQQDHLFFKYDQRIGQKTTLRTTLFTTYGRGYYEELAQFQDPEEYKINDDQLTDLVRRKWLKNNFYGISSVINYKSNHFQWEGNLSLSQYLGNHFGQVINSIFYPVPSTVEYYRNHSIKNDASTYSKLSYKWNQIEMYADVQFRWIDYKAETPTSGMALNDNNPDFHKKYSFFNPKIGLNYRLNNGKLYALWAVSHREPTRTDLLENAEIQPEKLNDWELGYQLKKEKFDLESNLYYMQYQNQLVLSGRLDDVGNPIRENSGRSYRLGIEFQFNYLLSQHFKLFGNLNGSMNKNKNYIFINDTEVENLGDTDIAYSPRWVSSFGLQLQMLKIVELQCVNKFVDSQYLNNTENTNLRLHSFFTTDLMLIVRPEIQSLKSFDFNFQIKNIFNKKYQSNGYVYDDLPYYYPQAGINFLLGVRIGI